MAPERVEGNVSHGRCPERPKHFAIVRIGKVALGVWFCTEHHMEAFYPNATPDALEAKQ